MVVQEELVADISPALGRRRDRRLTKRERPGVVGGLAMWKTTVHSHGVDVDGQWRSSIEQQMRRALSGLDSRIGHVHVRLYGEAGGTGLHTCYIRVDMLPSGGVALGDTAPDLEGAVARAAARIGGAVRREIERGRWSGGRTATTSGYSLLR